MQGNWHSKNSTCKKILVLQPKSLYKSCAVSNSYGIEIEICAGFGPVKAGFSCFHVRLMYNDFDCNTIDIGVFHLYLSELAFSNQF